MKSHHSISLIAFFALVTGTGCSGGAEKDTPEKTIALASTVTLTDAQLNNIALKTSSVALQPIASVLKAHGLIDVPPQNMVSISVPLGGYLKASDLLPGMHIRKGDQLAIIEDRQYIELQQEYLTEVAQLTYSEQEYERQRELNLSKATSDKSFQQVVAEHTSRKIKVKALAEKLKLIGIRPETLNENNLSKSVIIPSPIDGYVTRVNANIGKYVRPEDVLFELVNPTDIHLALEIFEKDIDGIYIDQELTAYTNNNPDKKYPCEVILVGKDLTINRCIEVHCHFKGNDPSLIPGLYMNADIKLKPKEALVLPSEAVVQHDNRSYVFLKKSDHQFNLIEVKTGISSDGKTEVTFPDGEPAPQDQFVIKGAYALLMSMMNVAE
jgi:cobalt-zinc-cadmium efflux system membrane fusion protein